ncbi:hypothetical protein ACHAQH_009737, partial [Verticillium albo-atrum]
NLLDQLEATKPGVTQVAELYWHNGNQALDKMEQIHKSERQQIKQSFDKRRSAYIQKCHKTNVMVSELMQNVKKTSVEMACYRSNQETKRTLDALERLKASLEGSSEVA